MYIPKSTIKRILKEAGATRISNEAMQIFQRDMNRMAFGIAQRAVVLARHAKRKTIGASDVKLAIAR